MLCSTVLGYAVMCCALLCCAVLLLVAGLGGVQQSAMSLQGPFPWHLAWPRCCCAPRPRPAKGGEAPRPRRLSSTPSSKSRAELDASLDFPQPPLPLPWEARPAHQQPQKARCRQLACYPWAYLCLFWRSISLRSRMQRTPSQALQLKQIQCPPLPLGL